MPPRNKRGQDQLSTPAPARASIEKHKPLTKKDLEGLGTRCQESWQWLMEPYPEQILAIEAQLEGVDTVVHAYTGFGKTAIAAGPHSHPSAKGKVTILVSPLLALHDEQVETFLSEYKLDAVAVNSSHGGCSREVMQQIIDGKYQVVVISPEMLLTRQFIKTVLQSAEFGRRVLSVVIDEAHVVSHWGAQFRKKYGTLGIIRTFLPRSVPMVALSATLPPRVLEDVLQKLQYDKRNYRFINVGNYRHNVSMVVRAIQYPMNTYVDLDFVIPRSARTEENIPKTFIYADNISTGTEIEEHLTDILPGCLRESGIIRPYNAAFSKSYRKEVMHRFRKGSVRILVCTDAAGMGCNVPDIELVVQWKAPASLSSWVQRAGRAARGKGRTGLAVLLIEPSLYGVDLSAPPTPPHDEKGNSKKTRITRRGTGISKQAHQGKRRDKKHAEARGVKRGSASGKHDVVLVRDQPKVVYDAADENLVVFIQTGLCRLNVWQQVFGNERPASPTVPCCDICHPELLKRTRPGKAPISKRKAAVKKGEVCNLMRDRLHEWREAIAERDFPNTYITGGGILGDDTLLLLSSVGPIESHEGLREILKGWSWYEKYGDELFEALVNLNIPEMVPLQKLPRPAKHTSSESSHRDEPQAKRLRPSSNPSELPSSASPIPMVSKAPQGINRITTGTPVASTTSDALPCNPYLRYYPAYQYNTSTRPIAAPMTSYYRSHTQYPTPTPFFVPTHPTLPMYVVPGLLPVNQVATSNVSTLSSENIQTLTTNSPLNPTQPTPQPPS